MLWQPSGCVKSVPAPPAQAGVAAGSPNTKEILKFSYAA
jgi:hypothetical protein